MSLQSILTDKKSRGIFGEVNLNHIFKSVFDENNEKLYKLQYTLPNGTIADSILFAPDPLGTIAIDSKFPLENYRMMVDKKLPADIRERYEKQFKIDVKKHIDAISENTVTTYKYSIISLITITLLVCFFAAAPAVYKKRKDSGKAGT